MSYFYLIHSDYDEFQKYQEESGSIGRKGSKSSVDFANKKLIINPDCPMQLILDYTCQEIGIDKNSDFDFATSKCTLLNIKAYNPSTSGLVAFTPQETYFLVLIEKDDQGNRSKIVPVFNSTFKEFTEFALHLKKLSSIKPTIHKRPSSVSGMKSHSSKHITRDKSDWPTSKSYTKSSTSK